MRKRAASLILCLCMVLSFAPVPVSAQNVENDNPFSDVEKSDWFYDGVQYVFEHELMKGTSSTIFETLFEPERATQRGMIVTILYRLDESPPVTDICPFEDVPRGSNYENAIIWAANNGIVTGYTDTSFGPYDDLTRQQMAAILYRYAKFKHYDLSTQTNLNVFTDSGRISNYARVPLAWANSKALINGITPTMLAPTEKVTRAQSAVILTRFCENVVLDDITPPIPEPVTYSVTFDVNYSGTIENQTVKVKAGDKVSEPAIPSRSGYTFKGWYTKSVGGSKFNFDTIINADLILYARWSIKGNTSSSGGGSSYTVPTSFSVVFNSNNGSVVATQSVQAGGLVTQPTEPIREGYVFGGWYTDGLFTHLYEFDTPVTGNIVLYAKWDEYSPNDFYTATFILFIDNYVDNADEFTQKQIKKGRPITEPAVPETKVGTFAGWYDSDEYEEKYDFQKVQNEDVVLFAKWDFDNTDSDNDALTDNLELQIGTDPQKPDTDGDSLPDGEEVFTLGTDPLKQDTDGNGINDANEDTDGDGLSNATEYQLGTNPVGVDSDYDGLYDGEEVNGETSYITDPLKSDTDGDGADDMWEIQNGFNPIEYNASFTLTVSPLEVDETTPVAAGVVANFESGSDISLVVSPISSLDNALLSPNIPGYLGQAYDFLSNGTIKSATITFNYDTAVGTIGDDFQPRIYYFNEETGTLEEVDNQVVSNGSVSAEVSHFSSYILLDKTDYAAVWNDEIKAPLISGNEGQASGIDVVFVIDVSGSMDEQGRLDTAKNAMSVFLDALDQHDRAALIKFTNTAQKLSDLTSDFALVKSYVSGLSANGGTSMYRGFGDALNLLTKANETYGYKMIVMLTDGYDDPATTFERQYADLVNKAISSDVAVYTIGVGQNVNTDMLTKIASDTAGGYHPANETDEITDAFEEIQSDTIDLKTDSNDDKIPDYFNDLIFKGELVIGNGSDEFKDVDFSKSADIDGDGLLNGEELVISVNGNQVYAQVLSNPLEADSDADGYTDYDEVNVYKSNPMKSNVSFNVKDLDYLATDSEYVSNKYLEFYENKWYGWLERGSVWIGNNVFGSNYDTTYLYKVILMEYLEQMVEEKQEANELRELYDQTREILSAMGDVVSEVAKNATKADLEKLKQLQEQLKTYSATLRATSHPGNFNTNIRPAIISIRENAWRDYTSATQQINALKGKTSLKVWQKVGKGAERVGLVLNVLDVATSIYDFYDTYAKFNAKLVGMADCVDTLEIIQKSNDAPNELKNACSELIRAIQNQSTKDWDTVKDALGLVGGKTARIVVTTTLIEKVAAANPKAGLILGAVILALSIEDFIFNVSEVSEKCTCLYAISKSSSIFATFFRSAVSSGDLNGEWRIVYDDGVQRTDDYFALAIMRKKSENQMKDADEANSFLLEWLFTKIMYKVSEIEENIGKIDALKMNYVAFTP